MDPRFDVIYHDPTKALPLDFTQATYVENARMQIPLYGGQIQGNNFPGQGMGELADRLPTAGCN